MTTLAIVKLSDNMEISEISSTVESGAMAVVADGLCVAPAHHGWVGGGYAILEPEPADVIPNGMGVSSSSIRVVGNSVKWVFELIPVEPSTPYFPAITSRQFWLAGLEMSITKASLTADIEAAVGKTMTRDEADAILIEVMETNSFERHNHLVVELAEMQGVEPYQLDEMWLRAASF